MEHSPDFYFGILFGLLFIIGAPLILISISKADPRAGGSFYPPDDDDQ
jgi:hypothetical protein